MRRLVIVAILAVCAVPVYAPAQQPDTAKLKADAQKVVSIVKGDKAKSQAYCELDSVSDQIDEATRAKDTKKVEMLNQRANDLEKQLGPEYEALFDSLNDADGDSKDVQDIFSMFDQLDGICGH
jgi:ABC-type transporter Mla subunit MlaD